MSDRGLFLSLQAIHRQLTAMPCDRYLVRLIHHPSRRPYPGSRLWTSAQLREASIVKFLRARNRDGYDVYFQPHAVHANAGYILLDLDRAEPGVLHAMCAGGHRPCSVVETSPDHLQAWVHVSAQPLPPEVASAISRELARLYHGDPASTDWRHLGRLAGFTNQKPQRRLPNGLAPWVKLVYAKPGLAVSGRSLRHSAAPSLPLLPPRPGRTLPHIADPEPTLPVAVPDAADIYKTCLQRLRIPQRFAHPDWSIADLWIAQQLLLSGLSAAAVKTILQHGPGFPRHHAMPEDYLHRTLLRAHTAIAAAFPARPSPEPSA